MVDAAALLRIAKGIEQELRRYGLWEASTPPPGQRLVHAQAVQFMLLPRLRAIAAGKEPMPSFTGLAAPLVREFDMEEGLHPYFFELEALGQKEL